MTGHTRQTGQSHLKPSRVSSQLCVCIERTLRVALDPMHPLPVRPRPAHRPRRLLRPPELVRLLERLLWPRVGLPGPERARRVVPLHLQDLLQLQQPPGLVCQLGRPGLLRAQVSGPRRA